VRTAFIAAVFVAAAASPVAALPPVHTPLQPLTITANTGEKPQSKVWTHDGRWWCVLPSSSGTWIRRLDGTTWTSVHQLSTSTSVKADVKPMGNVVHVLLYQGTSSALASAEYVSGTQTWQAWSVRPANVAITLDSGVETATIDVDSQGRMWLASDETDEIMVRHADSPYSTWSAPLSLAGGLNTDDICVVTALPNGTVGVLWSNQTTQRFGFRLHTDGADPLVWSADEVPASQSALNVGLGMSDDHLNVAVASDATLYAAVKTSYDTAGFPRVALLVRRPGGTWDNLYGVSETGTRGICLLDEVTGTVTVVYTSVEGSGNILFKESPTSSIAFGPTATTLLAGAYNEASSSKQNVSGSAVILASTTSGTLQAVGALRSGTDTSPPSITLTAPNGGEVWTGGTTQNITWMASDDVAVTAVDLELSTDGGSGWTPIASGLPNSGSYAWSVANMPTLQARVRATARDAALNQAQDASDADFEIVAGSLAPVGWWPMDEGGGPTVVDVSGQDNHGSLPNGANWGPGVAGLALVLNGTNQRATVPDDPSLDLTSALTLAAWIRPSLFATQDLIKKATINATNGYEISLSAPSSSWPQKVFFRLNQQTSGDTYRVNSTTLYPLDGSTWMHVAATYDGATMRLYINGALEASLPMPPPIATNALPLTIGGQSDGTRHFQGAMDDVRVYGRALSGAEIAALANPHTITATAGANGSIIPSGAVVVPDGADQSFTITPDPGFQVAEVLVDGVPMGPLASHTFDDVTQDHTIHATFASPITIDAGPAPGQITLANPTVKVPVRLTRTSGSPPIMAFSVTFSLNEPQVTLAAGTASIALPPGGGFLNAAGDRTVFLQPVDLGGGTYRADGTTLGAPCASTALTGTLFEVELTSLSLAGTGTVTVQSVILRDCLNATIPATVGATASVTVDRSAPSVAVTAPNGGETWVVGSLHDITWTAGDPEGVTSVELAYSTDGGASYPNAIATLPGTQTSYAWTIPASPGTRTRVRVTAVDIHGNAAADASDADFTIGYHTLTYLAGANGSISGVSPQSVSDGGSGTPVTAVPDAGYQFVSWSDGVLTATRTDTNVSTDLTVTATFVLIPTGSNALAFDGSSQYVDFGSAPELRVNRFTLELWFKRTGAGSTASSGSGGVVAVPLLAKGRGEADGSNLDVNYFLGITTAGRLAADYEEGTGQLSPGLNHPVVGATTLANDVWYHAAAVFDGSSLRLYLNGNLEGVTTGLAGRDPQSASIQRTTLGTTTNSSGTPEGFFAGVIDEPRIWSVARSQCQVIASMNSEVGSGTGLAGRWGLNEGMGALAGNSVAGSPDGNLVNGPAWVAGAPFDLTPPVVPAPTAPSDLSVTAPDSYQAQLSWTDHATSESGFEIERSTAGSGGPFALHATVGPDVTSFVDAVLDAETEYCYRVRAIGCAGGSAYTDAACATTTALLCRALLFTPAGAGTNAHVRVPHTPALALAQFTLELWMRREGPGIATLSASGGIPDMIPLIAKGRSQNDDPVNNVNFMFGLRQSTGTLAADFEEGPGGPSPGVSHPVSGATPIAPGVWRHVAATYDGVTWRLYLDGNLDAQLTVNRPAAAASLVAATLASAENGLGTPAGYFDGAMHEVRIWDHARTQAEIQGARLLRITVPTPGLVARWGLDEGAGSVAFGGAGTGHHGAILGSPGTDWSRTDCFLSALAVDPGAGPSLELSLKVPNPLLGRGVIEFGLPRAGEVRLEILDVSGRQVALLASGGRDAGLHRVEWDGRGRSGGAANGIYFLRIRALGQAVTRRFVTLAR